MLTIFRRVAYGYRHALAMNSAINLFAKGKYDAARAQLERFFLECGAPGPSTMVPVMSNVMFADLCERTGEQINSYDACKVAIEQLQSGNCINRINSEDKKYLLFRCKWTLSLLTRYIDSIAFQDASRISVRYSDLDLRRVSPYVRRSFPIPEDSGRAVDRYFEQNAAELARG